MAHLFELAPRGRPTDPEARSQGLAERGTEHDQASVSQALSGLGGGQELEIANNVVFNGGHAKVGEQTAQALFFRVRHAGARGFWKLGMTSTALMSFCSSAVRRASRQIPSRGSVEFPTP